MIEPPPPFGKTIPSVKSEDMILDIVTFPVGRVAKTTWAVIVDDPSSAKLTAEIDCKSRVGTPLSTLVTGTFGVGVTPALAYFASELLLDPN